VDGELFGNIACEDGVIVGEKGIVHGHLSARVIVVSGKVKGNLAGSERVKLYKSGEVMGDILTPDLSMEDGAVFVGSSRMKDSDTPHGVSHGARPDKAIPTVD
jgi:cytoskeletal protein CcmA (bactofilin family)